MKINTLINTYHNLKKEGYSCSVYGSVFNDYIAIKLNIKKRSDNFHIMSDKWIDYLWLNDKDGIYANVHDFILDY